MRSLLLPVRNLSALRRAEERSALWMCSRCPRRGLRAAADQSVVKTLFVVIGRRRRAVSTITAAEARDEVALRVRRSLKPVRRRQAALVKGSSSKRSPSSAARRAPRSNTSRLLRSRRRRACPSTRPKRRRARASQSATLIKLAPGTPNATAATVLDIVGGNWDRQLLRKASPLGANPPRLRGGTAVPETVPAHATSIGGLAR